MCMFSHPSSINFLILSNGYLLDDEWMNDSGNEQASLDLIFVINSERFVVILTCQGRKLA